MSKYCSKCGAEITEGSKFCKNCGAPVENAEVSIENQKLGKQKRQTDHQKKEKKTPMILGIVAVLIVILAGLGIKNIGVGVAAYEKPLKYEIDGINKNSVKTYKKAFRNQIASCSDDEIKDGFKDVKSISYQVESVENISMMGLLKTINVLGIESKDIEDAKKLRVVLQGKDADGEKIDTDIDFEVVQLDGKWYALTDLLY